MKRIILGGDGINNLMPLKYPWAWAMVQKSIANTWFHHQTSMARERASYDSLNPGERQMFLDVFATLTTSDIAVLRNVGASLMQHITAPEIEAYLARQIAEEGVHSITYQHVIESLSLDADGVYMRYQQVPEIAAKFAYAGEHSRVIHDGPEQGVTRWLESVLFYYLCFEGIWFYNGFSPIFALQRRNLMVGTGTQLQYILRDESMHVAFGVRLLRELMGELNVTLDQSRVHAIVREALDLEASYANKVIPWTMGYNADLHTEQAKYVANRRLAQLGFSPLYPGAANVLPWLDEQANIRKEKNFFETHVTEYQSASVLDGTW